MSRVGNNPIKIPSEVKVVIEPDKIHVDGKLGKLSQSYSGVKIEINNDTLFVKRNSDSKDSRSKHGLYRALIFNMIEGVNVGYIKELELVGVGYRASNQGQLLDLSLGFSHNIVIDIAPEIKIETISEKGKNPIIKLSSHDKQLVGFVSAKIRSLRKPEPYKGKGIKFVGETLRRKAGKSA
tara:strand:- start:325 stop:867 length:543 start_codon:yes stop_codon:yes gene_type:complete